MSKKRNLYSAEFKAKVALTALRNDETVPYLPAGFAPLIMIKVYERSFPESAHDH